MNKRNTYRPMGFVAQSRRRIQRGTEYDRFFPKPTLGTNPVLEEETDVDGTVALIKQVVARTTNQTKAYANSIAKSTRENQLRQIFFLLYNHVAYERDEDNPEQPRDSRTPKEEHLREPSRTWWDRKADCDCYSIFISSVLTNLGIPHYFRIVKMGTNDWYQHIYVIVPKGNTPDLGKTESSNLGNRSHYWVIDPVCDGFDQEPVAITYKKDFPMVKVRLLNGIEEGDRLSLPSYATQRGVWGSEFNNLGCRCQHLAGCAPKPVYEKEVCKEFSERLLEHLKNSRDNLNQMVKTNPNYAKLLLNLDKIIANWNDPTVRMNRIINAYQDAGSAQELPFYTLLAIATTAEVEGLSGLGDFKNWWQKNVAQPVSRTWNNIKDAFDQAWDAFKDFAGPVLEKLKKFAQVFLRWNPVGILMRLGSLVLISKNFLKISSKCELYMKYPNWKEAKAANVPWNSWFKSSMAFNKVRGTVKAFGASDTELRAALVDRRVIWRKDDDAAAAKIKEAFSYNKALLIGELLYNFYGENDTQRKQPAPIIVTDTIGETGWVVLVSGIPSIEAVAVALMKDGGAVAMNNRGEFYETWNGNWTPRANFPYAIFPFEAYAQRYYTKNADGFIDHYVTPENRWNELHKIVFNQAKKGGNPLIPESGSAVVGPNSGGSGVYDPNVFRNSPTGVGSLGEPLTLTAAAGAATGVLTALALVINAIKDEPEPEGDVSEFDFNPPGEDDNDNGGGGGDDDDDSGNMKMILLGVGTLLLVGTGIAMSQSNTNKPKQKPLNGPMPPKPANKKVPTKRAHSKSISLTL